MHSHIFSIKNIGVFEILTFEIFNEMLTNNVVSFEQPGPVNQSLPKYFRIKSSKMNECYILSHEEILLLSLSFITPVSKGVSSLKNGCHLKVFIKL